VKKPLIDRTMQKISKEFDAYQKVVETMDNDYINVREDFDPESEFLAKVRGLVRATILDSAAEALRLTKAEIDELLADVASMKNEKPNKTARSGADLEDDDA
jgi:hypothetical protein